MILRDCLLCELEPVSVERGDLRVVGDAIVERGPKLTPERGEDLFNLDGAVVLPGLVNAHTHLYSALARGMPSPERAPTSFADMLDLVWWRLDRALDTSGVLASALVGAHEAALCGTTTLIDHHASPNAIHGSLREVGAALRALGLRGAVAYEATDRLGAEGLDAGVAENDRAMAERTPQLAALVGGHASFTLSEASLKKLADTAKRHATGVHVHAAESVDDVSDAKRRGNSGVMQRFSLAGVLGPKTVLAHGVHLTDAEIALARESGSWLVHCSRSNQNNGVGTARASLFGSRAALGTDGIGADMLTELRSAFFRSQETATPLSPAQAVALLAGGHRLSTELFGRPVGPLKPGAVADLAIYDYAPPTPLTTATLTGHLLYGLSTAHVRDVLVAGRWIVERKKHVAWASDKIAQIGQEASSRLWANLAEPMSSLL